MLWMRRHIVNAGIPLWGILQCDYIPLQGMGQALRKGLLVLCMVSAGSFVLDLLLIWSSLRSSLPLIPAICCRIGPEGGPERCF